jgi:hypothetical protein
MAAAGYPIQLLSWSGERSWTGSRPEASVASTATAKNSNLPLLEKALGGITLALLLWPFKRRKRLVCAIVILVLTGLAPVGCGGSAAARSYSVTVTAIGGGVSQAASIDLTVTK